VTTSPAIEETSDLGPGTSRVSPYFATRQKPFLSVDSPGVALYEMRKTTNALEAMGIRQAMSGLRRSSLLTVVLLGVLAFLAGGARAQPALTPGQGATEQLFYLVLVPAVAIGVLVMVLVAYAVRKFRVRPGHTTGPFLPSSWSS